MIELIMLNRTEKRLQAFLHCKHYPCIIPPPLILDSTKIKGEVPRLTPCRG